MSLIEHDTIALVSLQVSQRGQIRAEALTLHYDRVLFTPQILCEYGLACS